MLMMYNYFPFPWLFFLPIMEHSCFLNLLCALKKNDNILGSSCPVFFFLNVCLKWAALSRACICTNLVKVNFPFLPCFPGGSENKVSACNEGDPGSFPGLGRSAGEGNGNPLQYSCLENPMDGGAWWITVHGVAESDTTKWLHFKLPELSSCICSCLRARDLSTWCSEPRRGVEDLSWGLGSLEERICALYFLWIFFAWCVPGSLCMVWGLFSFQRGYPWKLGDSTHFSYSPLCTFDFRESCLVLISPLCPDYSPAVVYLPHCHHKRLQFSLLLPENLFS